MNATLKSILMHGLVGLVGGLGMYLTNWVTINPDPHSWLLATFAGGLFTTLVAVVKKLFMGELVGLLPFMKG